MAVQLAYRDVGSGPPLVILHGLFGSGRNWTRLARQLGETWQVFALDLRNHGDSPWTEGMSYPALAEDVLAFLDRQGLETATVVGHSMGGKTAMALALLYPERVKALVVVDMAPVAYETGFRPYIEAMQRLDLHRLSRRAEADAGLQAAVPDPGIRAFLLQNLVANPNGFAWRLNLAALAAGMAAIGDFPETLTGRTYGGRTLFLGGGLSDYIGEGHRPTIHRLFPGAGIEMLPGVGHWVHAEAPETFLARVQAFLGDTAEVEAKV